MPERDKFIVRPDLPLGRYRHYKGGEYEVLMLACNEATHGWMVIYKALYDTGNFPDTWARSYDDFIANVDVEGKITPRFRRIDE